MKHRLFSLVAVLVLAVGAGISFFGGHAAAAPDYFYTNDSYVAIQGPNPYAVADQSATVTYQKAADKYGKGIYIDWGSPRTDNEGGSCYPALQTSNKQYNGDKQANLYLECGSPGHSDPQARKGTISIGTPDNNPFQQAAQDACKGKTGQELQGCIAGYNGVQNGKSQDDACKGLSGSALSACQAEWTDAQANGDNSPTCENDGGPLAWILCPIFNEMSDASQWLFQNIVQPFLITPPISTNPQDPSFQIWSNLRVYGDIFLVIALLVIVFGESIGGGLIDAYTAKKVLPRLLVAAVLINLSIYIVALLVDFSNILGAGIGNLLTAPLSHCSAGGGGQNCWDFTLSTPDQARVFGIGLIGFLASSTALAGFVGALIFGSVGTVITAAFFVMLPIFLSILAVFITLIIRKGLILMLVLISPVAFALYCLPNTERFFKRWWDLLIEALMVYPIIVAIFGVAEILSVTILTANGISSGDLTGGAGHNVFSGNLNRSLALFVAFLLQFLPLLAVPFAFRFAGGALSKMYEAATGAGARLNQLAEGRREHAKRDYQSQALSARGRMYHAAKSAGASDTSKLGLRRRAAGFAARRAGGYNVEGLLSAARAEKMKLLEDQIATGRDEEIRGLTVDKKAALASGKGLKEVRDAQGNVSYQDARTGRTVDPSQFHNYEYRENADGSRSFQSLGGAWISEQDVDAGYSRWGKDQFAQQGALSYEMRKALDDNQRARIETKYPSLATEGWGMSKNEAYGAWIGSAFANQNASLQYKYMNKDLTGGSHFDYNGFVNEVYEKRGAYDMSRMDATSIRRLEEAWDNPAATAEQKGQLQAIAQSMQQRMSQSAGAPERRPGEGDETEVGAAALGAGHVNQAMSSFVDKALGGRS